MQAKRFFAIRAGASMAIALVVFLPGAPEASRRRGLHPTALSSPHQGLNARLSIPEDPVDSPIQMALRLRRAKDSDVDGVDDREDECPETPATAIVDARGCPTDQDHDGVFDGIDQCANTTRGATVDTAGCPRDSDADGVLDGLDMCPETNPVALVKEDGCPYDSDDDGVLEGIDQCPATPMGVVVDERGCPVDTDGDGVPDGLDNCPDTSLDDKPDESGCSRVQRGDIVLPTIRFPIGRTTIAPGSSPALNKVAILLRQNPDITVEIGGHTDNEGPARLNRKISLHRAEAVKAYLVSQGVPPSRMATKGYGEVHPIATNRTPEGRAENRRIEFRVLSP